MQSRKRNWLHLVRLGKYEIYKYKKLYIHIKFLNMSKQFERNNFNLNNVEKRNIYKNGINLSIIDNISQSVVKE